MRERVVVDVGAQSLSNAVLVGLVVALLAFAVVVLLRPVEMWGFRRKAISTEPVVLTNGRPIYSPWQVTGAALLGGVLAGLWLVGNNFADFGWESKAKTVRIVAVVAMIAVLALLIFGPEFRSNVAIGAISAGAVRFYAESSFGDEYKAHLSHGGMKRPQWHWLLAGVLGMAATYAAVFALFFGLAAVAPGLLPDRFFN